jgi:hypothetical protein
MKLLISAALAVVPPVFNSPIAGVGFMAYRRSRKDRSRAAPRLVAPKSKKVAHRHKSHLNGLAMAESGARAAVVF